MARAGKQSGYTHTRRCGARAASTGLGGRTRGVPLTPSSRGGTPRLCSRCYLNSEEHKLRRVT